MISPFQLRVFVLMLACALPLSAAPIAATVELADTVPQQGLLVLANGSVIPGEIMLDGDYYRVLLAKGRLQIRVDQVDFFCQTMEEAYARRRSRRISDPPTADAHLEMVRWCVQHELFSQATRELQSARAINPSHQLLDVMERQLVQAQELALRKVQPEPTVAQAIIQTSAAAERIDAVYSEIPTWARTEFIKRIQPMMVHSCATGGCHALNSSQQLRIDRNALDGVGNPELIQRNLSSVIATINFDDPEASRLLALGATAHGAGEDEQSRALTPHQLEILRAWVTQLVLKVIPANEKDDREPQLAQVVVGMNSSAQQKHSAAEPTSAASDPFDPAAFNSEQAGKAESQSKAAEAIPLPESESPPVQDQQ
jgi:hypothetical protein